MMTDPGFMKVYGDGHNLTSDASKVQLNSTPPAIASCASDGVDCSIKGIRQMRLTLPSVATASLGWLLNALPGDDPAQDNSYSFSVTLDAGTGEATLRTCHFGDLTDDGKCQQLKLEISNGIGNFADGEPHLLTITSQPAPLQTTITWPRYRIRLYIDGQEGNMTDKVLVMPNIHSSTMSVGGLAVEVPVPGEVCGANLYPNVVLTAENIAALYHAVVIKNLVNPVEGMKGYGRARPRGCSWCRGCHGPAGDMGSPGEQGIAGPQGPVGVGPQGGQGSEGVDLLANPESLAKKVPGR